MKGSQAKASAHNGEGCVKKNEIRFSLVLILTFAIVGGVLVLIFSQFLSFGVKGTEISSATLRPAASIVAAPGECPVTFNPPLPEDAPADIKDAIMLGYNILMDTQKYAAKYVGNKLNCKNCHFEAGRSKEGLSLVGVGATYPKYTARHKFSVDLVSRTNDCFERSMNGRPLPSGTKEMNAIITYYQWISKGLPIYAEIPWLGLKHIQSTQPPDLAKGRQTFAGQCAACHGANGQGTQIAPPLWGNGSFNDGAGMAKLANLAAFANHFMPKGNPDLSPEQAFDVGAFVTSQPRPHFVPRQ
jgi:thiosulfate dehydrogenase